MYLRVLWEYRWKLVENETKDIHRSTMAICLEQLTVASACAQDSATKGLLPLSLNLTSLVLATGIMLCIGLRMTLLFVIDAGIFGITLGNRKRKVETKQ